MSAHYMGWERGEYRGEGVTGVSRKSEGEK